MLHPCLLSADVKVLATAPALAKVSTNGAAPDWLAQLRALRPDLEFTSQAEHN